MEDKQKEYYKSLYEKLLSEYTKEELAEAFVFPPDLNAEEEEEAERQLKEDRLKRLANRTPEERVLSGILRIKYQMKEYIDQAQFDQNKTTIYFLKEYLKATDKKQQELAADIGLHVARLRAVKFIHCLPPGSSFRGLDTCDHVVESRSKRNRTGNQDRRRKKERRAKKGGQRGISKGLKIASHR